MVNWAASKIVCILPLTDVIMLFYASCWNTHFKPLGKFDSIYGDHDGVFSHLCIVGRNSGAALSATWGCQWLVACAMKNRDVCRLPSEEDQRIDSCLSFKCEKGNVTGPHSNSEEELGISPLWHERRSHDFSERQKWLQEREGFGTLSLLQNEI